MDYLPPLRGISQSAALAEALSFATAGDPALLTVALTGADITDEHGDPMAVYLVNDFRELRATLEDDAPIHPGETVTFVPCPMRAVVPEESDGNRNPEATLEVDGVTRELTPYLRRASFASVNPVRATMRTYLPSDTSAPHEMPPLRTTVRGAQTNATTASITCGYGDIVNVPFPRVTYTAVDFPGLAA